MLLLVIFMQVPKSFHETIILSYKKILTSYLIPQVNPDIFFYYSSSNNSSNPQNKKLRDILFRPIWELRHTVKITEGEIRERLGRGTGGNPGNKKSVKRISNNNVAI